MDLEIPHTDPEVLAALTQEDLGPAASMRWKEPDPKVQAAAVQTARELDVDYVTALRLERETFKGRDYSQYRDYLQPHEGLIRSPEEMVPGIEAAAQDLAEAIKRKDKVAIFADYDVDGNSSAHVFRMALESVDADTGQIMWGFASGSFGLTLDFVQKAKAFGAKYLITLDNGSTATTEVLAAQAAGMKVILIDHHTVDLNITAEHHINPQFTYAKTKEEGEALHKQGESLLKALKKAQDAVTVNPEGEEPRELLAQRSEEAYELMRSMAKLAKDPTLEEMVANALAQHEARPQNEALLAEAQDMAQEFSRRWRQGGGSPELAAELHAASRDMVAKLNEISGADPAPEKLNDAVIRARNALANQRPDRLLRVANERVRNSMRLLEHDTVTAAPVAWQFGRALQVAANGEEDANWKKEAMYMAGMGLLGDNAPMGTVSLENRAFCRVPLEQGEADEIVPPFVRLVARELEEDPTNPGSMMRTRALMNLPKRMPEVSGEDVFKALACRTEEEARPYMEKLMPIYEDATAARNVMREQVKDYYETNRPSARPVKKGAKPPTDPEMVFSVVNDPDYYKYSGQAGVIAQQLTKEYRKSVVVASALDRMVPKLDDENQPVIGADGKPEMVRVYKMSARPGSGKIKLGELHEGKTPDSKRLQHLCTVGQVNSETGEITADVALGGHPALFSGTITEDRLKAAERLLSDYAIRREKTKPGSMRVRQRDTVWTTKRLVPVDGARLERLEREALLLRPSGDDNYPTRISVAARARDIGAFNEEKESYPAKLELPDGSTRECDIKPEAINALKTGAFFEVALSLGDPRYYVRDIRPILPPKSA